MKIIEAYKAQKAIMENVYNQMKKLETNGEVTDEELDAYLQRMEQYTKPLIDMRENSKVKFHIATLITNLDLTVWHKALSIRSITNRIM